MEVVLSLLEIGSMNHIENALKPNFKGKCASTCNDNDMPHTNRNCNLSVKVDPKEKEKHEELAKLPIK
jgi:hypothetical protein